jgi:hypothetical protein
MQYRAIVAAAGVGGAILLAACSGQTPTAPGSLSLSPVDAGGPTTAAAAEASARSTVPMQAFGTGVELPGASSLTRTDAGISMTVQAEGLVPGHAHTIWFVAFNSPQDCIGGCQVDDVLANRGTPAVRFAAGHVAGNSGRANFGGHLAVGNTGGPPCAPGPSLGSCGPGLLDARGAIIHLIVRTHGAAIPELLSEQISSFNGGCPPNACANLQFAEHLPAL